ncbi:hypothetical protein [Burkholderia pyrrocinia]|uniref:hypothetical protein n=1 Tax=Burkholderia pyrrocinia TaxID=60550 RepID=UPI001048C96F|nr:hypothetical protein [Burkholderia pyrrocinia]TDA45395.1 hypothetical protein EVG18_22070 [Burkholderia pyrrocinia]
MTVRDGDPRRSARVRHHRIFDNERNVFADCRTPVSRPAYAHEHVGSASMHRRGGRARGVRGYAKAALQHAGSVQAQFF